MKPEEIEQMKADMEAGTPGPFVISTVRGGIAICDRAGTTVGAAHRRPPRYGNSEQEANGSRFARVPAMEAGILRLREALEECEEFFDNRADADCDQDGFIPNDEMKMLRVVRDALGKPS